MDLIVVQVERSARINLKVMDTRNIITLHLNRWHVRRPARLPGQGITPPVIEIEHVTRNSAATGCCIIFIAVAREENVVMIGKSGVGKSVLIKCIIGLMRPECGTVQVFGENIPDLNHDELDRVTGQGRISFPKQCVV